ncbi:winged helix-turn-helix transcriptional regulator [Hoeflea sp. TYP-13]|uniref:winged helix-turn-helix transcriptional regulator n=1 Tax=Hoeflea sp. TYP-13 TaxID=3230023 RepID=UPI0034C5C195
MALKGELPVSGRFVTDCAAGTPARQRSHFIWLCHGRLIFRLHFTSKICSLVKCKRNIYDLNAISMAENEIPLRSHCPVNFALEAVGDRWSLIVMRDILLNGKFRFRELMEAEENIASNILSERLSRLAALGIIEKIKDPHDRRQFVYQATSKGEALMGAVLELGAWGAEFDPETDAPPGTPEHYKSDRAGTIAAALESYHAMKPKLSK